MIDRIKKFIAVLMAIWLPLFTGGALASSISMQSIGGGCQAVVAHQESHHSHIASASQHSHHSHPVANQDESSGQNENQDTGHTNCGVCHLACCGYLATVDIKVAEVRPQAQSFIVVATQFQSITSAPLDPPPLTRV